MLQIFNFSFAIVIIKFILSMRLLIYLTIMSLGLNIAAPIKSGAGKPGCFAVKKINCPMQKLQINGTTGPFSCPKNPKKWDCQKKYFNLIYKEIKVEKVVFSQFFIREFHTNQITFNYINDKINGDGMIQPYDPRPPGNLLLII